MSYTAPHNLIGFVGLFAVSASTSVFASPQCDDLQWRDGVALAQGFDTTPLATASIDHDNDGVRTLFVAGAGGASGIEFEGLVQFVNGRWEQFGPRFTGTVAKIGQFDLDGDGVASLIVFGALRLEGSAASFTMLEWNGSQWIGRAPSPGWGVGGILPVGDACVLDDDGDGVAILFVSFYNYSTPTVPLIMRWTGAEWSALSVEYIVSSSASNSRIPLAAYDSDADGREELIAPVSVSVAGTPIVTGMARWNGTGWSAVSGSEPHPLLSGTVRSFSVFDTDGDGAMELIAAGSLASGQAVGSATQVAAYDGKHWRGVGVAFTRTGLASEVNGTVSKIAAVRFGASEAPTLLAFGHFNRVAGQVVSNIVRWSGAAWVDVGGGVAASYSAYECGLIEHDATGDREPDLVCTGPFIRAGTVSGSRIAVFDGEAWSAIGQPGETLGTNAAVYTSVLFDHDGDGRESLIAGGPFTMAGAQSTSGLAAFDGVSWEPIANPWPGGVEALCIADLDEDGVPSLYAAGNTLVVASEFGPERTVAEFTYSKQGGSWAELPNVFTGSVSVLAAVDHDQDGHASLFAGGSFNRVDALSARGLAYFDGSAWIAMWPTSLPRVQAICAFDDDGDGDESLIVSVGHNYPDTSGERVRKWTGSGWSNLGSLTQGHAFALQVYDHDRDGEESLFALGQLYSSVGLRWALQWVSGTWQAIGPSQYETNQAGGVLLHIDHDGDGSETLVLSTTDPFTQRNGALHMQGDQGWKPVASGLGGGAPRMQIADLEGDGTQSIHLDGAFLARAGTCGSGIAIIDACIDRCPADLDGDGIVGNADLAWILATWGACGAGECKADLTEDGAVDSQDLVRMLDAWGACE